MFFFFHFLNLLCFFKRFEKYSDNNNFYWKERKRLNCIIFGEKYGFLIQFVSKLIRSLFLLRRDTLYHQFVTLFRESFLCKPQIQG